MSTARPSLKEAEVEDPLTIMSEAFLLILIMWTLIRNEKRSDEIRCVQGGMALNVAFGTLIPNACLTLIQEEQLGPQLNVLC